MTRRGLEGVPHGSAPAALSAWDFFRKPWSGQEAKVWPLEGAEAGYLRSL